MPDDGDCRLVRSCVEPPVPDVNTDELRTGWDERYDVRLETGEVFTVDGKATD
jgi:hypothetical protein